MGCNKIGEVKLSTNVSALDGGSGTKDNLLMFLVIRGVL